MSADLLIAEAATREALLGELRGFEAAGIGLLVIDGGDGTVRDVLSVMPEVFAMPPLLSVIPSGKTNILAFDLGIRDSWTLSVVRAAAGVEGTRVRIRTPLDVRRDGEQMLRGFMFGAAGLVRGVTLAQELHRARVVHNTAIGLTLASALFQFSAGGERGAWRRGEPLTLAADGGEPITGPRLITMATTLHRFPFLMRPFGPPRPGLKVVDVDAPPRKLWRALPKMLWGRGDHWLARHGYRRTGAQRLQFALQGSFILDGEIYPGGELSVTEGPALRFLTP